MSQPIHVRPRPIKVVLAVAAFVVLAGASYWALDRYLINPEASFENLDFGTKSVAFTDAPPFELPDLRGNPVKLSDYKNKIVIVNFWASWCGPCIEEFPSLMKYLAEFKGDVVLLAVSQDNNIDAIHAFLKKFGAATHPDFHILLDLDRKVGKTYGVNGLPESFIFSRDLKLARKIVGFRDWMSPASVNEVRALIQQKL